MNHFLETIKPKVQKRADLIEIPKHVTPNTLNFCEAIKPTSMPAIIAEIKFASPSKGKLYQGHLNAIEIAGEYLAHGASALSILTEPEYFQGTIETVQAVRKAFPNAPILLKDFILSQAQIAQGLLYGANAVLLIVAFLSPKRLKHLYNYAIDLGLTPLIEVHDLAELDIAMSLNPKLIGMNHRHLKTLNIDLDISEQLMPFIPENSLVIAESGIETRAQLNRLKQQGVDGCLIGSHFMKEVHPGHALTRLLEGES